tara:strand:- start:1492 stop:2409 length:918 start_codon:yes stop_codon:yes gene_type:complete
MKQDPKLLTNTLQDKIIDLETKYMDLFELFFQDKFFNIGLRKIEKHIQNNYSLLNNWKDVNKCALALERLVNFHIHTNLNNFINRYKNSRFNKCKINQIYASPLSSDTAFITNDAVVNIDCKSVGIGMKGVSSGKGAGNKDDWTRLRIGQNQTSFRQLKFNTGHNKKGPSINVDQFQMQKFEFINKNKIPVLSFILDFLYEDDGKNFRWFNDKNGSLYKKNPIFSNHVKLCCIPNGELSNLFHNDIIYNIKSYKYPVGMPKKKQTAINACGAKSFRIEIDDLADRYSFKNKIPSKWKGVLSWDIP